MTNATMKREYNPGRSPLFGVAAVLATAVTLGTAVLLPTNVPTHAAPAKMPVTLAVSTPRADVQAPAQAVTQVVSLPAVEVVGTRPAKVVASNRRTVPVTFKQKG